MDLFARTCNYGRMNISRFIARAVAVLWIVVGGLALIGVFASIGYTPQPSYVTIAAIPLGIGVVILALAFFFEVLAAVLSWVVALGLILWGIFAAWETGQWLFMLVVVIGPMALAGFLYFLASQTQKVCELEEASASPA